MALTTDQQGFENALISTAVDYFRSSDLGQKVEAEYTKQAIGGQTSNPLLWIGVGLVVMFIIYPLLHF